MLTNNLKISKVLLLSFFTILAMFLASYLGMYMHWLPDESFLTVLYSGVGTAIGALSGYFLGADLERKKLDRKLRKTEVDSLK